MLEGRDDVTVELWVGGSASPTDGIRDAGFFYSCDRAELRLTPTSSSNDGEEVESPLPLVFTGGTII